MVVDAVHIHLGEDTVAGIAADVEEGIHPIRPSIEA